MLETKLEIIWGTIKRNEKEYADFKALLENGKYNYSREEFISVIKTIEPHIDCTRCAYCCKKYSIYFKEEDVKKACAFLGLDWNEVLPWFSIVENNLFKVKGEKCPFLKDNLCTVYEIRPETCSAYPRSVTKDISQVLENIYCPIIFNAVEEYKAIVNKRLEETQF